MSRLRMTLAVGGTLNPNTTTTTTVNQHEHKNVYKHYEKSNENKYDQI